MSAVLDHVAKGLAGATSRREVLKYLAGVLFLGSTGCLRSRKQCHKVCSTCTGSALTNCLQVCEACPTFESLCGACSTLACCPPEASSCCTSGCTNLNTDANNCGSCGTVCSSGTTPGCCAGACTDLNSDVNNCATCGTVCTGTTPACCSGTCTDLNSDNNNCGACGTVCATGTTCQSGACA